MITENNAIWSVVGMLGVIIGAVFIVFFIIWLHDFLFELRNVNDEINRNEGRERKYWTSRRRRLWLSLIPFVRWQKK